MILFEDYCFGGPWGHVNEEKVFKLTFELVEEVKTIDLLLKDFCGELTDRHILFRSEHKV